MTMTMYLSLTTNMININKEDTRSTHKRPQPKGSLSVSLVVQCSLTVFSAFNKLRRLFVHVLLLRSGIHWDRGSCTVLLVRPVLFPEFPSQLTVHPWSPSDSNVMQSWHSQNDLHVQWLEEIPKWGIHPTLLTAGPFTGLHNDWWAFEPLGMDPRSQE